MNQSPQLTSAPSPSGMRVPHLAQTQRSATVKETLENLKEYGFTDTKACLEAIRIKGTNMDDIVEYLVNGSNTLPENAVAPNEEASKKPNATPTFEMPPPQCQYDPDLYEPNPWATSSAEFIDQPFAHEYQQSSQQQSRKSSVDHNPFKRR